MKIASITIFCNENFRLINWLNYYNEYKDEIYLHVIVNNGDSSDNDILKKNFPNSIILNINDKSLIKATNYALHFILKHQNIDSILIIGNDIQISKGSISDLNKYLYSNSKFGMISPILLSKDSDLIEMYGAKINRYNLSFIHQYKNININEVKIEFLICDALPGGINLAKKSFYEIVGVQDEELYMYADELDMGIRAQSLGFLFVAYKNTVAIHQHLNNNGNFRGPLSAFLMGRNEIYLARKHYGYITHIVTSINRLLRGCRFLLSSLLKNKSSEIKSFCFYYLLGVMYGFILRKKIPPKLIK